MKALQLQLNYGMVPMETRSYRTILSLGKQKKKGILKKLHCQCQRKHFMSKLLLQHTHQIWRHILLLSYIIIPIKRSGAAPHLPCLVPTVLIFSIISPLQDATALTISVSVCDRHTLAAASTQPHLSPSPRCLMSARLFKGEKCDNRERRSDGWMNESGVSVYETAASALMWCVKRIVWKHGCVARVWMCVCAGRNWSWWVLQRTILTF